MNEYAILIQFHNTFDCYHHISYIYLYVYKVHTYVQYSEFLIEENLEILTRRNIYIPNINHIPIARRYDTSTIFSMWDLYNDYDFENIILWQFAVMSNVIRGIYFTYPNIFYLYSSITKVETERHMNEQQ